MGRTVPTFRQLIDDAIARWSKFRRALRREDQEYFDRLFRRVRSYTQAATYQASDNPMEAILLSIALDQEKRLDALERAAQPPEAGAGSTRRRHSAGFGASATWSPPEAGAGSTWSPPEAGAGSTWSPPEAGAGSTWSLPEAGAGSTWSLPEECLEKLDAPRIPDENQRPDTPQRMAPRSLPEPTRDEAVADRAEPDAPPVD